MGLLVLALAWLAPAVAFGAFGLTTSTGFYTVDTGGGLVFKVDRSNGDIASLAYNGTEYQYSAKGSHINSGLGAGCTVSATTIGGNTIKITVTDPTGTLTHYYMARSGSSHIYMATYFTQEPAIGLVRFIVRVPNTLLTNGPVPSDIRGNVGAIESADIFGMADLTTRSKHYSNHRLIDWSYTGATGTGVGAWMVRSNHEGDSGGPFYRSLINQCGDQQELYEILNYGEAQTESFRLGVLNGPYTLVFTNGGAPPLLDTSWFGSMGLLGYVAPAGRGSVTGSGLLNRDTDYDYTVGFSNPAAQYWTQAAAGTGAFAKPDMLPGTYTMNVYKNELVVYSASVAVSAGATTALGNIGIVDDASQTVPLWRIGNWDGTPGEFLNGDKVTTMHPSDVRMSAWNPGPYVVGTSTPAMGMPCYQWKDVGGGSQAIQFNLTAAQKLVASTVRVGITVAYEGARPKIALNAWTYPTNPGPSIQPSSRTLTVGTYRGNNSTYTFAVPASALVEGLNTLYVFPISGSGATGFLSAGYSLDCIEMFQGTEQKMVPPGAPPSLSASAGVADVSVSWAAASGAASYNVLRATVSGGPYTVVASGVGATTYSDTGVSSGTAYYYVVSATNSSGTGLTSAEAAATPGTLRPALHLRFDEAGGTTAADSSGHGWNGTLVGGPVFAAGRINNAVNLSGSSQVVTLPAGVVSAHNDCTIAAWVKPGANSDWSRVFDFGTGPDNYLFLTPRTGTGVARFAIRTTATPEQVINGSAALTAGVWTHVAVTLSGNTGTLYVNGVAVGTNPAMTLRPSSLGSTTQNYIGDSQFVADPSFSGLVDEFQIYNRALTAGEIAAFAGPPAAPSGLTATGTSTQVALAWTAVSGAAGYHIKRATVSGGPYSEVGTAVSASYADAGLTNGTTFYYIVTSANLAAESANSAEASATPHVPLEPVAIYALEGNANDTSGNGNHGTPASLTYASGIVGAQAGQFNGTSSFISIPRSISTDFTVSLWAKTTGTGGTGAQWWSGRGLVDGEVAGSAADWGTAALNGKFALGVGKTDTTISSSAAINDGAWHHLAATRDNTTGAMRVYVDGVLSGSGTGPTGARTAPAVLRIGGVQGGGYYSGTIDAVYLYDRVLGLAEISALALAPTALAATGGNTSVALTWTAPSANATRFNIKRATVSGGPYTTAGTSTATSYTDTGLTNGTPYFYVVSAENSGSETPASAPVSAVPHMVFAAWQQQYFTPAQLAAPLVSGPAADANGDGTKNIVAYASDLSPWASAASALPTSQITGGYLTLTFTRRKSPADVTYTIKVSGDLANWNSGASYTTETSIASLDANTERVTVRDNTPASAGRRFIRLEVGY